MANDMSRLDSKHLQSLAEGQEYMFYIFAGTVGSGEGQCLWQPMAHKRFLRRFAPVACFAPPTGMRRHDPFLSLFWSLRPRLRLEVPFSSFATSVHCIVLT